MRDEAWRALGADAEARYQTLIAAWESGSFPEPCLHVNMLGTLRSHAGRGYGRRILDAVQEVSRRDPPTLGVSLSTEDPKNVPFYEHCGYRVVHHVRVTDALETWLLVRDNDAGAEDATRGASA
jgi:GNAT superfamily N-acetyltransferase